MQGWSHFFGRRLAHLPAQHPCSFRQDIPGRKQTTPSAMAEASRRALCTRVRRAHAVTWTTLPKCILVARPTRTATPDDLSTCRHVCSRKPDLNMTCIPIRTPSAVATSHRHTCRAQILGCSAWLTAVARLLLSIGSEIQRPGDDQTCALINKNHSCTTHLGQRGVA